MAVRRSKRKAEEEDNAVKEGEEAVPTADEPVMNEENTGDATMEEAEAPQGGDEAPPGGDEAAEPPVIKKPRLDVVEGAAIATDGDNGIAAPTAAPTTTEEEIAKTMVQAAVDPANPVVEEAETTAPAEAVAEAIAAVSVAINESTEHHPPAEEHTEPADKPEEATTETPSDVKQEETEASIAANQEETEAANDIKQEETAAIANSITAEAVAAMTGVPVAPAPIYKKEAEEYEEPDDGAEIPEEPDTVWNANLLELLLYKAQYRTLHVQATYDNPLHAWVDVQRRLYRRHRKDPKSVSVITQTRLTALDAINFPFTLRGSAHWDRYFSKLHEFKKKHGHCLVPRLCEFAGLGDWVIDQRRQYKLMMQGKPSVLDPERQRKLEDLGFVWVVRNRPEWNNRYQELLQYREKYGDTKVPQHYKEISGLGKWVAKQREQYRLMSNGKHSFLTPDRLEKLNEAGFVWSVRKDGPEEVVKTESGKGKKSPSPSIPLKEDGDGDVDEQPRECDGELENPDKKDEGKDDAIIPHPAADQDEQEENAAPSVEATVDSSQEKKEETKQDDVYVAV